MSENGTSLPRGFSSVSFWSLISFLGLVALQYVPVLGVILMMLGAPLIAGLLVHVFLISLLVEAYIGSIPRILILVPVLAYAGYYIMYANEAHQIAQLSAELKANNPGKILTYDPNLYSLIIPSSYSLAVIGKTEDLISTHDVPVTYEPNSSYPEGYLSYRLITKEQCNRIEKDTQARIQTFGVLFHDIFVPNLCMLRFPDKPQHTMISVTPRDNSEKEVYDKGIHQHTFDVSIDGKIIASYKTASVWQLPMFPSMAIGCALNDAHSSWDCFAQFTRNLKFIDGIPDKIDRTEYDDPISVVFAIHKRTMADLVNFKSPDTNAEALEHVKGEASRVDDSVFDALKDIIDGKNPKPPFNLGYSIASKPKRLSPYAQGMVHRFVELNHADNTIPYKKEQLEALTAGLGALSHEDFDHIIIELFNGGDAWTRDRVLYLRVGEGQKGVLPLYRAQFFDGRIQGDNKVMAVLGICRVGSADPELIAAMKSQYDSLSHANDSSLGRRERNLLKQALFVTLLQLGEKPYLTGDSTLTTSRDADWYTSLLNGQGMTAIGPNNCMPRVFWELAYITPSLGPILK